MEHFSPKTVQDTDASYDSFIENSGMLFDGKPVRDIPESVELWSLAKRQRVGRPVGSDIHTAASKHFGIAPPPPQAAPRDLSLSSASSSATTPMLAPLHMARSVFHNIDEPRPVMDDAGHSPHISLDTSRGAGDDSPGVEGYLGFVEDIGWEGAGAAA